MVDFPSSCGERQDEYRLELTPMSKQAGHTDRRPGEVSTDSFEIQRRHRFRVRVSTREVLVRSRSEGDEFGSVKSNVLSVGVRNKACYR
jgi:hypothetical protein